MNAPVLLRPTLLFVTFAAFSSARAATDFSDDFSSSLAGGAASFSDYTLYPTGQYTLPPDYRVIINPGTDFTNDYFSYYDHTVGTAGGAMLFFDGAASPSLRVYYHSVAMTAGVPYTISYWGASGSDLNNPVLNLSLDGATIGTPLDTVGGQWQRSTAIYTPTVGGVHTFAIYDSNTLADGNDGSVDDVLVTDPVPEPSALAALGLGAVAVLRRRKRTL